MARVRNNSRRLVLGAAFICMMALSGAIFGAIGGMMLVLVSHAVLRTDGGTLIVLITCGSVGIVAATLWSLILMARPAAPQVVWQPITRSHQNTEATKL